MKSNLFRGFKLMYLAVMPVLLCVAVLAPVSRTLATWTTPDTAPPGGNVAAPINISATPQTKLGSLTIAGEFLKVSPGSVYLPTNNSGIFWFSNNLTAQPHVNFDNHGLYLSPGDDSANHIELQGKVKITQTDGNQGELSIQNLAGCSATGVVNADAAGKLYCDTSSSGAENYWTRNGNNLYPNDTNWKVGVGTNTPTEALHVLGNAIISGLGNCTGNSTVDAVNGKLVCGEDQGTGGGTDEKVKVSSFDQEAGFLQNKLAPGSNISLTKINAGGNEQLEISATGGGASLWEGTSGNNINPITPAGTKVRIGWSGAGDTTKLSVKGEVADAAIYGENHTGYAGYFSGQTAVMNGSFGIGTTLPNQELSVNGDMALSGGIYKLNGTTKFFADCAPGNSIRAIAADGTVTCEFDDFGAAGSDTFTVKTDGSGSDSPNFLANEITAGTNITLATVNVGGDVKLQISSDGGTSLWEGTSGNNINPITPAGTKVRIGWSGAGDATQLSVKNSTGDAAIYAERSGTAVYAGYFSGKTVVMSGSLGIGTLTPNKELGLNGSLALFGGIYKLDGTTKFFADTCSGANQSIKTIAADGTVTCETDDIGGGGIGGSGTTNYIPKFTSGTTLGNSQIFDNGTFVGIGTAAPTHQLEVKADSANITAYDSRALAGANASLSLNTGGQVGRVVGYFNDRLAIDNGAGTEWLTVKRTGKVGIGNTDPAALLSVSVDNSASAYTGNHTIAANNNSASNYNAITGIKGYNGVSVNGSGVYGELHDGSNCTGTCAGIYGSAGGNTGTGEWAGYFDGNTAIDGALYLSGKFKPSSAKVCDTGSNTCYGNYLYTTGTTLVSAPGGIQLWYFDGTVATFKYAFEQITACPAGYTTVPYQAGGTSYYEASNCTGDWGASVQSTSDIPYFAAAGPAKCISNSVTWSGYATSRRTSSGCAYDHTWHEWHRVISPLPSGAPNQLYEIR